MSRVRHWSELFLWERQGQTESLPEWACHVGRSLEPPQRLDGPQGAGLRSSISGCLWNQAVNDGNVHEYCLQTGRQNTAMSIKDTL